MEKHTEYILTVKELCKYYGDGDSRVCALDQSRKILFALPQFHLCRRLVSPGFPHICKALQYHAC